MALSDEHPDDVRGHVARILKSRLFKRLPGDEASNVEKVFRYLVEAALAGIPDSQIKSEVIKADVFPHHAESSSIARVVTAKLGEKLKEYYSTEGRTDTLVIYKDKGGYALKSKRVSSGVIPALSDEAAQDLWDANTAMNRRTLAGCQLAKERLDRVLSQYDNHPQALAVLALLHVTTATVGMPSLEELMKAQTILNRLRADGIETWESCLANACLRELLYWDWKGAEALYGKAILLSNGECRYDVWYTSFLAHQHRAAEAIQILEPLVRRFAHDIPARRAHLGLLYLVAGRLKEAASVLTSTIELFPREHHFPYLFLAFVHEAMNDFQSALSVINRAPFSSKDSPIFDGIRCHLIGMAGGQKKSKDVLKHLISMKASRYYPASQIGIAAIGAGQPDVAVKWLKEAAIVEHDPNSPLVSILPVFRHLYENTAFQTLVEGAMSLQLSSYGAVNRGVDTKA